MAMDYSEKVMDHFTNPRNVGEIEDASGEGTVGNAVCGDIMRIYLDIDDDNVIQDAKFKTFGAGEGQDGAGSAGGHEQGRHGGAGRAAGREGALLSAG